MTSKKLAIEQQYYFDSNPSEVFRALTEPSQLVKWFLASAKIKPRAGGSYTFTWQGGSSHTGVVKKAVAGRVLVLSWPDRVKGKTYLTQASFTFSKKGSGTLLTLKHTGFRQGDDWVWLFGAIQSGWAYFLTNLKSVLGQGKDLRSKHDNP